MQAIASYRSSSYTLTGMGEAQHLNGEIVSAGFFRVLGVQPLLERGADMLTAIGRLKPGISVEQVRADLSIVARHQAAQYPDSNKPNTAAVVKPEIEDAPRRDLDRHECSAVLVSGIALHKFIIRGCAGLANVAQWTPRRRCGMEVGVRRRVRASGRGNAGRQIGFRRRSVVAVEQYLRDFFRDRGAAGCARTSPPVCIRTAGDPAASIPALRASIAEMDRDVPLYAVRTMEDSFATAAAQPRFQTLLTSVFAAMALLLSAIGLYAVPPYTVAQRLPELACVSLWERNATM